MISVFPKILVYCPMNGLDQSGHKCITCPHYRGWETFHGAGTEPQMFISCGYSDHLDLCPQPASTSRLSLASAGRARP